MSYFGENIIEKIEKIEKIHSIVSPNNNVYLNNIGVVKATLVFLLISKSILAVIQKTYNGRL